MKPVFYLIVIFVIVPIQASLLSPLSVNGITPDVAFALVYITGLLTNPAEATLAGMAVGIMTDISSASLIGLTGVTRGLVGLSAGLLGRHVLNIASLSNIAFLAAFSVLESAFIFMFIQISYGAVPFFSMLFTTIAPQALSTALVGTIILRFIHAKGIIPRLIRPSFHKES